MAAKNGARQTAIDADNKDERREVLLQPSLLTWDLFATATLKAVIVFLCLLALIFVLRRFAVLPKEKPSTYFAYLWSFTILFVTVPLLKSGLYALSLVLGIFPFILVLIVRAFKRGRTWERRILFCYAAAAFIGLEVHSAYAAKYREARILAARDGRLFPEDITPIPPFDPSVGIAYRDADVLPEFESVFDETIYARIPIERGFTLEDKRGEGDSISFTLSSPNPYSAHDSTRLRISVSLQKEPIVDPSMREYLQKKYTDLDIRDILMERRFPYDAVYEQRKVIYLARDAAIILQFGSDEILSQDYQADGIVGIPNAAYEFSVSGSRSINGKNLSIKNYVSDWAYAFIEANRVPDSAVGASAARPAQPAGPE